MKRRKFIIGFLCGALLFGGTTAYAAGIIAERSNHPIYVDGELVQMEAYTINGNNYVSGNPLTEADFTGKLEHVTISDGETTTVMEHAVLVQCKKYGKEYWFVLRELSAEELMAAKGKYYKLIQIQTMAEQAEAGRREEGFGD